MCHYFKKCESKLLYKVIKKMLKYCKQRLTVYTMSRFALLRYCALQKGYPADLDMLISNNNQNQTRSVIFSEQ